MVNWWPWNGGDTVVVNNNIPSGGYYSGGNCCGGHGGGFRMPPIFATMMKYQMIQQFFNMAMENFFPNRQQQQSPYGYMPTMYPGLYLQQQNLDGRGGAVSNEQQDDIKMQQILSGTYKNIQTLSDGTVLARDAKGNLIKASSMEELFEMAQEAQEADKEKAKAEDEEEEVVSSQRRETETAAEEEVAAAEEGAAADGTEGNDGNVPSVVPRGRRGIVPEGWYKAKNDKAIGEKLKETFLESRKKGHLAAAHFAETILKQKVANINKYDIKKLQQALIAANPSVFDEDGNFIKGFKVENLDKLDIPSMKALYAYRKESAASNGNNNSKTYKIENPNNEYLGGMIYDGDIKIAEISVDSGMSFDKRIITQKGYQYEFVCEDGDHINRGAIKFKDGRIRSNSYNVTKIVQNDGDNNKDKSYNVKTNSDGTMNVQVNNQWVTLEEFCKNN